MCCSHEKAKFHSISKMHDKFQGWFNRLKIHKFEKWMAIYICISKRFLAVLIQRKKNCCALKIVFEINNIYSWINHIYNGISYIYSEINNIREVILALLSLVTSPSASSPEDPVDMNFNYRTWINYIHPPPPAVAILYG